MDKKFKVKTLIKNNHKFGGNQFVRGRITGIGYTICGFIDGFATEEIEEGYIYTNMFTPEEYDRFINAIEENYPGLCIFNYKESK